LKPVTIFITGTDTSVGKTVFASALTRLLIDQGLPVAALKPICSGGRDDARMLRAAMRGALTLDQINPWHFRAPISPLLAAGLEKRRVKLRDVVVHARRMQARYPVLIIEGAGGLLSPLGEDFDSRDLIKALRAAPIIVAPNRLGVINHVLLTLAALPRGLAQKRLQVVLVSQPRPDASSRGNLEFLREKLGARRVHVLPRFKLPLQLATVRQTAKVFKTLNAAIFHLSRRQNAPGRASGTR
jgi:dethiobiotin synthetase